MTARTSDSHPLYVDWFEQGVPGRLGMTMAPGTKDHSSRGPRWDRDVGKDLRALVTASVSTHVLVSLLEDHELERYRITSLRDAARTHGLEHIEFPIPDLDAPASMELSPPTSAGTSSTGITGDQGPTRWRGDGFSPCSSRLQTSTSASSRCEGDRA